MHGLHRRRASAFTLVELLVVLAIIGVLVALLLPAVQGAREAARRMTCVNNLKNHALALHNFHDANQHFPAGFDFATWRVPTWGWTFHILPHLEQSPLHNLLSQGPSGSNRTLAQVFTDAAARGGLSSPEAIALQTSLPIFRCPSDSTPDLLPAWANDGGGEYRLRPFESDSPTPPGGSAKEFQPATSNYVGCQGYFYARYCQPKGSSFLGVPDRFGCDNSGILFIGSEISFKDISDGASNTLLVGERDDRCNSASWIGTPSPPDWNEKQGYFVVGSTRWGVNEPARGKDFDFRGCEASFSSAHPGGANFALADASVRFVNEDIDYDPGGVEHGMDSYNSNKMKTNYYPANWPNEEIGVFHRLGSRDEGLVVNAQF